MSYVVVTTRVFVQGLMMQELSISRAAVVSQILPRSQVSGKKPLRIVLLTPLGKLGKNPSKIHCSYSNFLDQ